MWRSPPIGRRAAPAHGRPLGETTVDGDVQQVTFAAKATGGVTLRSRHPVGGVEIVTEGGFVPATWIRRRTTAAASAVGRGDPVNAPGDAARPIRV